MTLDDLVDVIRASDPDDWSTVVYGGPAYLMQLGEVVEFDDDGRSTSRVDVREHDHRWVYKPDIDIGLAFGMRSNHGRDLTFPWSDHFIDKHIDGFYVDMLYRGQPVRRDTLLYVYDVPFMLPVPQVSTVDHPPARFGMEYVGEYVTTAQWTYCCLIATLARIEQTRQEQGLSTSGVMLVEGGIDGTLAQ